MRLVEVETTSTTRKSGCLNLILRQAQILLFIIIGMLFFLTSPCFANIYDAVHEKVIKQASQMLGREITIEKVDGMLVNQVTLHGVKIARHKKIKDGVMASAEKMVVQYNPLKILINKGDVIPAISHLSIYGLDVSVERYKNGHLNVEELAPKSEPGKKAAPFPFYGQIHIKSGSADYTDFLGFGPNSLASPFALPVENIKAEIDLRFPGKMLLRARGQAKSAEIYVKGDHNLNNGRYNFDFDVKNIAFRHWGDYVLPIPNFKASSGSADLEITLKSPPPKTAEIFIAKGKAQIKEGSIALFNNKIKSINGLVTISQKEIGFSNLFFSYQNLPHQLNGRIFNFSRLQLDLNLRGQGLEAKDLQKQANFDLGLKGRANYQASFSGAADNPFISGQAEFLKGEISGDLSLNFKEKIPAFASSLKLTKINLKNFSQNNLAIAGIFNGEVKISGNIIRNKSVFSGSFQQASILGQSIKNMNGKITYEKGDINIEKLEFASEKSYLKLSGTADRLQNLSLIASTEGLHLKGKTSFGTTSATIASYSGPIKFKLDNNFFAHPLKNIFADGNILLRNIQAGPQKIEKLEGVLTLGQGILSFKKVKAYQGDTILALDGSVGPGITSNLIVSSEALDIKDLKMLALLLPADSPDFFGKGQVSILIRGTLSPEDDLALAETWQKLNAKIQLNLSKSQILQTHFDCLDFSGYLSAWQIRINALNLKYNDDFLSASGEIRPKSANFSWQGKINLKNLKYFTQPYGRFEGIAQIKGSMKGGLENPSLFMDLKAQDFRFNSIVLEKAEGSLALNNYQLFSLQPIKIENPGKNQTDSYEIAFALDMNPNLSIPSLSLEAKVKEAQAENLARLTLHILSEIQKFTAVPGPEEKNIPKAKIKIPDRKKYIFGRRFKLKPGYLEEFDKFIADIEQKKNEDILPFKLQGKIKGRVNLNGPLDNLSGSINGKLDEAEFNGYKFESLIANLQMHDGVFNFKQLELSNQGGKTALSGAYSLQDGFNAKLKAENMPLSILQLIFKNKFFDGRVNLNASLSGPWQKPYFRAIGAAKNITITNQKFDRVEIDLAYQPDSIQFNQLKLVKDKKESTVIGTIPLNPQKEYQLSISLYDQALALSNLFQNAVVWESGNCQAELNLSGPSENISMNGSIKLDDSKMRIAGLDIKLQKINADLNLNNSQLQINRLAGFWQEEKTSDWANSIDISGSLNLKKAFSSLPKADLNLKMQDADFHVNLPRLFSGAFRTSNLNLTGPFYLIPEAKDGPTLKGRLNIYEGKIILPEGKSPSQDLFFKYDLVLNLQKNTFIQGGDASRFDFYLNLMAQAENLQLKGNYKYPSFFGKVNFERGMINIFNRDLVLIDKRQQSVYYPYNLEALNDNTAVFKGYSGPDGVLPELTLAAEIKVVDYIKPIDPLTGKETTDKTKFEKKEIYIVAHIKGTPTAKEKEKGLNMQFDAFEKKSATEMFPVNYSEQKIKVMLLPEFLKASLGLNEGSPQDIHAEEILVDYLDNRLQNIVLRDLERRLEKQFNVESLSLEYNFGRQIRNNMAGRPPSDRPAFGETLFGIGVVKGFFDRLYIDVRYKQISAADETAARSVYNYELRYKLGGIWSISYWREPDNFINLLTGTSKATLQALLVF